MNLEKIISKEVIKDFLEYLIQESIVFSDVNTKEEYDNDSIVDDYIENYLGD